MFLEDRGTGDTHRPPVSGQNLLLTLASETNDHAEYEGTCTDGRIRGPRRLSRGRRRSNIRDRISGRLADSWQSKQRSNTEDFEQVFHTLAVRPITKTEV